MSKIEKRNQGALTTAPETLTTAPIASALPDGTRLRKVKFAQLISVAWMHTTDLEDREDRQRISMVLAGPLVWVERIMGDERGHEKRGLWAVPVTNVLWMSFPEEVVKSRVAAA